MSEAPLHSWERIWAVRQLDASRPSRLAQLMAADGLDTAFGSLTESAWLEFVTRTGERLGATRGTLRAPHSVFDVGCGAGAFLQPLHEDGCRVGGVDRSEALIGFARAAMPDGQFDVAEASALDASDPWDVVVSCGVFMYFPSLAYAEGVLHAMAGKARRAVAVLDLPDVALREEAVRLRRGTLGEDEYEERYRGLDHLYYPRDWVVRRMEAAGLSAVVCESQTIAGYANGAHRFNVFGWRSTH